MGASSLASLVALYSNRQGILHERTFAGTPVGYSEWLSGIFFQIYLLTFIKLEIMTNPIAFKYTFTVFQLTSQPFA